MDNSDWYNHIDLLRTKIKKNISKKELSETLKKNIINSIPKEPFGILLSGGVDSTLIAKICKDNGVDFRCFCVGTKGSVDVKGAKIAAEKLDLDLIKKGSQKLIGTHDFSTFRSSNCSAKSPVKKIESIKIKVTDCLALDNFAF